MESTKKLAILAAANENLRALFPAKFVPITFDEIEKVYQRNVLSISVDAKTKKGISAGYLTGIQYFAPGNLSGVEVCPLKSLGCNASCLFSAGRGRFYSTTRNRIIKTLAYHFDAARYVLTLKKSIKSLLVKAKNKGLTPVVRLNGTSDILWERNTDIIQSFPTLQFYDYTKIVKRLNFSIPANYHLTFSLSEENKDHIFSVISKGYNVAAVFRAEIPKSYANFWVISGDNTDLRFLDKKGCIVGLKAKGKAKHDVSGFVLDLPGPAMRRYHRG